MLDHRKLFNKVGDKHYSYANDVNLEMYARKLPLLQVIKYLPKSVELATAASLDYAAEAGTQALTIESVVEDGPMELDSPAPTHTPYDEKFELLCWNDEERSEFLKLHKDKDEADIHAILTKELDQ